MKRTAQGAGPAVKEDPMTNILVTYASKYGSTAEIAETIATTLRQTARRVDCIPIDRVLDAYGYDVIIIGSAIYAGQWPASVARFLERNLELLKGVPFYIFTSGPASDPQASGEEFAIPVQLGEIFQQINPRDVLLVGGKIEPEQLNWFERLIIRTVKAPTGDYRDMDMVREWAESIARAAVKMTS